MKEHPKVLIICDFNQNNANGITIGSYFKGWDKKNIAVADWNNSIEESYKEHIDKYYCFGDKEVSYKWPLSVLKKIRKSESYESKDFPLNTNYNLTSKNHFISFIRFWLVKLLSITGIGIIRKEIRLSKQFSIWLSDFNPDFIYTSFGNLYEMKFLIEISHKHNIKLIIHIFDDFVNSLSENTILKNYWKKKISTFFKQLLELTHINLTISEKMAEEFTNLYKKKFNVLFYPIEPNEWIIMDSSLAKISSSFKFIYTGKIDVDTTKPMNDFIDAIEIINTTSNNNIMFDVWSQTPLDIWVKLIGDRITYYYKGKANHREIPFILSKADGLLLPLSYSNKSIKNTRLSFSTKTAEYMISGRPIFLLAPRELAVSEYLEKHLCAYIVDKNIDIKENIIIFVNNYDKRNAISNNAIYRAKKYHSVNKIQKKLKSFLK
jgi:glycosyltransferase involved in cell wall biosynthesis